MTVDVVKASLEEEAETVVGKMAEGFRVLNPSRWAFWFLRTRIRSSYSLMSSDALPSCLLLLHWSCDGSHPFQRTK